MRLALVVLLACSVSAHMSMWDLSTFDADRENGNSDQNSLPLENMNFDQWWFHGNLNHPPAPDVVFQLPANGQADAALSSNKAFTPPQYGGYRGWVLTNPRQAPDPWVGSNFTEVTNTHAPARNDVAGCAWGIAYKSDPNTVQMNDFVIFSVVHDCPSRPLQAFKIPNLPACPNGKCICSWFWIHKSIGGSDQMYMTPFVCNVTGALPSASPVDVARAQAPRKCLDPSTCFFGPRNPMYWKNTPYNMPEPGHFAPTYSILYGFPEGAQNDIFVNTNPNPRRTVQPFPAENKCTNTTINPRGFGSRLTSDGNNSLVWIPPYGDNGPNWLYSPECLFVVELDFNGNLIIKKTDGTFIWQSSVGTSNGHGPYTLKLSTDGSLTLTDVDGTSGTMSPSAEFTPGGTGPYRLDLTDFGVLVLRDSLGYNRWESSYFDLSEANYSPLAQDPPVWTTLLAGPKASGLRSSASHLLASVFLLALALLF